MADLTERQAGREEALRRKTEGMMPVESQPNVINAIYRYYRNRDEIDDLRAKLEHERACLLSLQGLLISGDLAPSQGVQRYDLRGGIGKQVPDPTHCVAVRYMRGTRKVFMRMNACRDRISAALEREAALCVDCEPMERCLVQLTAEERACLEARYRYNRSYAQMARETQDNDDCVARTTKRAVKRIEGML